MVLKSCLVIFGIKAKGINGSFMLYEGPCESSRRLNLLLHLLLNAISTGIIASSHYFKQVLVSPTQPEIDKAQLHRLLAQHWRSLADELDASAASSFSGVLLLVATVCVLLKVTFYLAALMVLRGPSPIVTLDDAIESFLVSPDPSTENMVNILDKPSTANLAGGRSVTAAAPIDVPQTNPILYLSEPLNYLTLYLWTSFTRYLSLAEDWRAVSDSVTYCKDFRPHH
ncbi:hypothetical protein B0H63DRAFT_519344 [Podospora didyma]|uniref:DUF6536 domain-containing protein n=1 Tax=Podospora didyma TaxID=330526 RepID=A0AAE0NYX1_9PEZI|nr:hypothetical protein B0H63DRAFT_519344 [Podospora didyma]